MNFHSYLLQFIEFVPILQSRLSPVDRIVSAVRQLDVRAVQNIQVVYGILHGVDLWLVVNDKEA